MLEKRHTDTLDDVERQEILKGMIGANLVGFQVREPYFFNMSP